MAMPKTPDAAALLALLRAALKASGKSQLEVARDLGVNASMISQIFSGVSTLPLLRVRAMAAALGLSPKVLMKAVLKVIEPSVHDILFNREHLAARSDITDEELYLVQSARSAAGGEPQVLTPEACAEVQHRLRCAISAAT